MLESDGVTWREVIAIEAEARQAGAREALDVARLAKALHMIHAATMAEVCGQPDTADAEAIAREYARLGREAP